MTCTSCGEEILNQRWLSYPDGARCQACAADHSYYRDVCGSGFPKGVDAGGSGNCETGPYVGASYSKALAWNQLQQR
jgi:hypothetical protein